MNVANLPALVRAAERATLWPWVVTVTFNAGVTMVSIVEQPACAPPAGEDFLPAGAKLDRCDVFPAARFDDMPVDLRPRYRAQYHAYLLWRKAKAKADLDPVYIDKCVERWLERGAAA